MGSGLLSASSLLSAPPLSETYANVPGSSRAERVARITYGEAFMKRFRTIIDGENHGRNRLMIEFFTSYPRFRGPLNQQLAKTHKPKKQSIAEPEDFILKERPHVDDRADAGEVVAIKRGYVSTLHCVEFEGGLWHLIIKYRGAALHAAFVADAAEAVRVSPSDIMNVSFSQRKCIILCDIYHAKSLDQEQVGCFLDMFSFPRVWKLYQSLQRLIQYRCADGDASATHLEHLVHDVYAGEPDTPLAIRLQETASPATTTVSKNVHVLPQASLVRPTPSQSGRRRVAVPEIPLIHSQRVLFRGPHWQSVVAQQPKRLREALVRDGCRAAVMASAVSVVRMDATKTGLSVHLALTCPPHVTLADVTECVNDYNFPESWMVYDKHARGLLLTPSPSPESAATVSSAPTRSSATVASESLSASPSPAMNMFSAPRQSSTSVNSHQVHFDGARWADVLSDNAPIWRGAFRRDIAASLQCSPTEIVVEQHHLDDRGLMVTFSIMHASPECQTTDQLRPKLLHAAFTNMWGLYEVETPVAPKRQGYVSRQQVAAVELSDHGQESPIPAALSITSATMKEVTTLNTTDTVYLEGGNWDVVIVRCPEELHEAFASDVSAALELPPEALTAFKPLYAAGMLTSYTVAHPSTLTTRQVRDRIRSHALPRTWELYKEVSMFIASSEYGRQSMDSEGSLETRELIPSKESGPRSAEVQQLLSSALQLFDSVTSERHLVTHDLQEPPREGVQSTELAALHEQPLAWSTSNELDASLLTRSSWCGRTTTPEPSVVSRHLHTLEGDRWDDVIAMRNDELHAAFADDVAYACELPPTSVKNIHADFVDGLVMSYSVVHHPSLSEAAINAAVQASPMTCTWALYDTTGPCLTHRLEMKRTFPGDRWAVVLARIPNRVRSVFCEETSECLNVPIEHVELLDVTTGSLIVDFAVNFHEPRDVDKQRTKVTAFGYPRLMSLLHEPEYKHAPTAREPVLMGRQPWHIEQLPHGGQHLPSHHASLRESAEGPTSAQLARDPTMELSATHSSSQEPSSHQNDTISEAPPRREYGIRQPTQLAAPRNLSFSTSLSTTPTAVSGAFAEAGVQPRLAQHATPSEGLMHSVDSTLDTKEGRRMSAQRTSLGEPQTEFLFSVPVAIIHQSLGSRGPLRRAEEMRKPSATHSVNISQELENVMPSQSTVYPMGYEYDPRVESMSLRAAEEMLPQFSPRSAQCASEGLEYPMLSPSPSASIQKDTLFAEEVGRSVGAQQSIAVVRAAEADVVQRSAVPAASLHASVADLDVARSVHMVSLAEQHVNPSRVDTPTLAVSQTMPELGQLYGDRLNALRTHAGVVPIARAERGRRHPLAQRSGGVASTVLRASFAESGLRPNSAHLNKAHDTVLQSVESTVLGEHETTTLEQAADRRVSFGTPQRELLCSAPVSFIHQSVGGGSALRTAGEMHRPSVMHSLNLSAAMDHEMPSRYRYDPSLDSMSLHAAEEMVSQISPRAAQRASEGLEYPMLSPSPSTSIQKDTLFAEEVGRSVGAQQSIELFRARSVPLPPTMAQPNLGHSMEEVQRGSAPKSLTFRRAEEVPMDSVASTALLMVEEAVEGHSLGSPRSIELAVLRPSALQMQAEDGDQVVHAHMMEFGNSPQPAVAARKKVSLVLQSPTSLQDRETSFSGAPLFRVQAEPVQEDRRVEIEVRQELTGIISQRGPLERSQHAEDAVDGTAQHSTYVARAMENEFRSKSSDYPMGYEYDPRMDRPLRSLGSPRGAALVEHTARPVAQQQREDRYDAVETAMMEASVEEPQTERTVTVARRRVEEIHSLTVSPSPKFSGFAGKPLFRVEEEDDLADRRGAPVEPTIRQEATRVISQRQVFGWSICAGESTGVRSSTTTSISHEDFLPMGYDVDLPFDRADRTRKLLSLSHYSRMRDGDRTGTASRSSFANKFSTMSMHGGAVQDSQADVPRSAVCHVPPENLLKASSSSSVPLNQRSLLGPGVLLSHSSVRDGLKGRSFERDETPELRAIRSVQDSSSSMEVLRYGGGRQMNMSGPRQDDNFLEIGKEPALVPSRGPRTGHSFLRMTGPRSMELTTASGVSLEARVSASASCYPMMYEMDSKFERQKEELVVSDSAVLDSPRTAFAHLLAAIQEEEEMAMQQLRGECPSLATGTPLQSSVASSVVVRAETAVLPTSWEDQIPAFATDHAVFLEGDEWGTVLLRAGDEGIIAAGSRDLSRAIGIEERLIKVEAPQVSSAGLYLHFQVHHGDQLTMEYVDDQVDQGTLSYLWSVYYQYALAPSASMRMMRPFQGGRWARLQQCDPDEVRRVFADETAALLGIPTDHVQVMDMTHDHHIDFAALFGEERQLAQQRVLIATFDYPMLHQLVAGARVETVGPKSSVLTAAQARASVPRFQGFEQSMMSQFSCPAPDIGTRREVWVHQPQWRPPLRFRTIVEPPTFVSEMRAEEKYALEPSVVMQEEHSVQSPMPLERELSHYGWMMHNLREDVMLARKAGILIAQPRGRAPLRFGTLMEPATSVIAMRADSQRSSLSSGIMRGYNALMNDPLVSEFSDCDFLIHNRRSDVLIAKSSGVPIAQPLGRPPLRFRTLMEPATQVMAMRAGSEIASIPSAIMKQYDALMNDPLVHEFSDCNFLIHNLPSDTIVAREAGILITQPLCRPPLRRSSFMEPATSIIAMRAGSQRSSLNSGIMRGYDALMNDPLVSEFSDCDFLIHNRRSDPIVLRRGASTIYQHSWRAQMRFRTLIEPPTSVVALRAESECVSLPSAVIHDYGKLMGDSLVREFSDCDWMVHNQRSDAMLAIKKIQPITQTLRRAPMRFRTLMESATLVAAMHAESEAASLHSACISDYGALMNDSLVHEFSDCEWLIHNVRADLYITQIPVVTIRQKMVQAPVKQSTWTADAVAPFGQRATPKVSCPISVVVVSQKPKRPPFRYHSMRGSEVGPVVAQKERQEERPLSGAEQWVEVAKHEASTRNSSSHSVYFDGPKWKSLLQKRRGEVESAFCRDIAAAVKVPLDNVMVDHAEYADGMLMSYTVLHPDSITPAMISECVSQSPMEDTWALYDGSRRSPPLESHSFRVQLHGSGWGEVLSNHAAELTAAFGEDVESILKVPASSLTDQKLSFRKGRLEIRFAAALPSSTRKSEASKQLEKATFAGTWELYRQLRQDERFMESTNQTQVKSRRGSASGLGRSQRIYHEDDLGIPTAVDALEAMAHESSDDERSGRSHGLLFEGAHWEEIILLHRDALRAAFVEDVAMSLGRPASAVHEVTLELVSGGMMARFMVHAHAKLPPSSVTERIHAYDFPRTWVFFQSCDRLSLPSASPMERTFKGDHWPRILRHHASAALRAFVEDTADCLGLLPTSVQVSRFAPRDNSVTVHFEVDLGHHSDSRSDPRLANTTLQDYPFPKLMTLYDDVKEAILQEGTSLRSSNDYSQPSEEEFLSQSVTVHSVFVQGPWLERANIMSHLDALRRAFGDDIATITELPLENMDWIEPVVFDDGMLLSYVVRHAAAVNTGAIDKLVDRSPLTSTWKLFDCLVGNHDMAPMQHFSSYSSARRESTSRMLATHPDSCCFTMHFDGAAWPALLEQQADEVRRRFEEDATTALAAHTGSDKNSNEAVALSVVPLTNGMFVHYAVPEWLGTSEADLDKKIAHYDFPLTWELFDSFSQEVDPVHSQYSPRLMEVESARKPLRAEQTTLAYDSTHMRKPTKHKDDKRRHDRSTEAHSNDSNNPQHANSIFINSAVLHDEPRFDARESKLVFYSVPEDLRQSPSPMSSSEGIDRRPSWISAKEMRSSESRYHAPTAVIPLLSQTISREQESTLGTSVSPSPANSTSHPYSQKLSSPSYAPDGLFRETWEINNAGGQSSSPTVNGFVVRPSDQLQLLLHRLTDVEEIMRQRYADYKGSLTSPK